MAALLCVAGGCAAALAAPSAILSASPQRPSHAKPAYWLARAAAALSLRNYKGILEHELGGQTETLRVFHRVGRGGVAERLVSMDGSGREFIRRGAKMFTYLPDARTVLVERSPPKGLLGGTLPRLDAVSTKLYRLVELSRARISGRMAQVIAVEPRDALRYGYRIWIDEATAMPLKTQLRTRSGRVIEQLVFTSLTLPAHITDQELAPGIDTRGYHRIERRAAGASVRLRVPPLWRAASLPRGFRMLGSLRQVLPTGPVEHLIFSDGLASVSVFVAIGPLSIGVGAAPAGSASIGGSSAYSTVLQGYRVTAVGEVPPVTVRTIARSIRLVTPRALGAPATAAVGGSSSSARRPAVPTRPH